MLACDVQTAVASLFLRQPHFESYGNWISSDKFSFTCMEIVLEMIRSALQPWKLYS